MRNWCTLRALCVLGSQQRASDLDRGRPRTSATSSSAVLGAALAVVVLTAAPALAQTYGQGGAGGQSQASNGGTTAPGGTGGSPPGGNGGNGGDAPLNSNGSGGGGGGGGAGGGAGGAGGAGDTALGSGSAAGGAGGAGGAHGQTTAGPVSNTSALSGTRGTDGAKGLPVDPNGVAGGAGGGGGGGGGFGLVLQGAAAISNTSSISGGDGGTGGDSGAPSTLNKYGQGGGGGGGGIGIQVTVPGATLNNIGGTAIIKGGNGGDGGVGMPPLAVGGSPNPDNGAGGLGGAGVAGDSIAITNSGTIGGGNGGNAPLTGNTPRSPGGDGGHGIIGNNNTITNSGTIQGGNGGNAAGDNPVAGAASGGAGGDGITGSDLTVINSGTIANGLGGTVRFGNPGSDGHAITFTGGTNRLELHATSIIKGIVDATAGVSNTLALGGTAPGSFDVGLIGPLGGTQYRGFQTFEVTGSAIWTLTGIPSQDTPWQLLGGTLSVDNTIRLGPEATSKLTFNGGTLQVTGTTFTDFGARPIEWTAGGGGIDIVEKANTFMVTQVLSGGPLKVNPLNGQGTLKLTASDTFTATDVYNGALLIDGTNTLNSPVTVHAAGTLGGNNAAIINGDVINAGTLAPGFGLAVADAGKTMTITGNYTGQNGQLAINAFLGDNTNSKTDQLIVSNVINGTMGGSTAINVTVDPTSPGGTTTDNGIPVVLATGMTTTDPKAFTLGKDVTAGAKGYVLLKGQSGTPQDLNSWYLCSTTDCVNAGGDAGPGFIPPLGPPPFFPPGQPLHHGGTPMQSLYGTMARQLGLMTLGTFHERNGDQRLADTGGRERAWARLFGEHMEQSHAGTVRPSFDGNFVGLQGGFDLWQFASLPGHRDNVGLFAAHTEGRAHVSGLVYGVDGRFAGSTDFNATNLGAYWSHIAPGWYTDAVLMGTLYDGDGRTRHATDVGVEGSGVIASLEGGFTLARFAGLKLEPQAQLVYQYVNLDEAHHNNSTVDHRTPDALHGRIGLRLAADSLPWILRPYLKANIWQDFVGADRTTWGGGADELVIRHRGTTLELGGGFTAQIAPNVALWAAADWSTDIGGNEQERESVSGNGGLRITW